MNERFLLLRICRLIAPASFCVLILIYVLSGDEPDLSGLCAYLLSCGTVILYYPLGNEPMRLSIVMEMLSFILVLLATIFLRGQNFSCLLAVLAISSILLAVFVLLTIRSRYSNVLCLFQLSDIWKSVLFSSRLIYCLALLLLSLLFSLAINLDSVSLKIFIVIAALFLDGVLYARNVTGHTFVISEAKERQLLDTSNGKLRLKVMDGKDSDPAELNKIYERVLRLMAREKPFLRDDYSINDMMEQVGTNRSYLSHVINVYFGKNFRQFINCQRVLYSVELMRENPKLKVVELAVKSGFHSSVSYTMSFKINMKMTPSEYLASLRDPSDPSILQEEDK